MKRSLAKESLAAALDLYLSNEVGALDSSVLAEIAMTHMESVVGMHPPLSAISVQYRDEGHITNYEWEPEDEKK